MSSEGSAGVEIRIERLPALELLGAEWAALDKIGTHSFFQSWGWIGPWLSSSPTGTDTVLLRAVRGDSTIGLATLTQVRSRFFRVRQGWLNASGDPQYDRLAIEHNGFATTETNDRQLSLALIGDFSGGALQVDELVLPGMCSRWPAAGLIAAHDKSAPGFTRRLEIIGGEAEPFGSRNMRQQLRRAKRKCEKFGELQLRRAEGNAEKLDFFVQMKELHRASWQRRDMVSAFDNPYFEPFCRNVIVADSSDNVDLLRLEAGSRLLGVLLNFRRHGVVYNYQSGFQDEEPSLRPGYVTHAAAISYYSQRGAEYYDFLAQPNQLKRSFSTDSYQLYWQTLQRRTWVFRLEQFGRVFFSRPGRLTGPALTR